ncbi:MAG: N-formylglutamate amidohydrolase [Polyangiales bacterium]
MSADVLLLSCEHGGARVPPRYARLFESRVARRALGTHRGCDLGALPLARSLSHALKAPLEASTVTRLLVDLNRSVGHPRLFSEFSRKLDATDRAALLDRHYFPHRDAIESWIDERSRNGRRVVHVGVHTFTPRIDGQIRSAEVGLLYDPSRDAERSFCKHWKAALLEIDPGLRVRRNYPYLGKADGLVTHLRRVFPESRYVGIELEVNQALLSTSIGQRRAVRSIAASLRLLVLSAQAGEARTRPRRR